MANLYSVPFLLVLWFGGPYYSIVAKIENISDIEFSKLHTDIREDYDRYLEKKIYIIIEKEEILIKI